MRIPVSNGGNVVCRALVPLLCITGALLTSCLDLDETMRLEKDGSGSFSIVYGMPEEAMARAQAMVEWQNQFQALHKGEDAETIKQTALNPFLLDEESLRRQFAKYEKSGVKLRRAKATTREGWRYMTLHVTYNSLASLVQTNFFSNPAFSLFFGDSSFSLKRTRKNNYVFDLRVTGNRGGPEPVAPDQEVKELVDPILNGFKVNFKMALPAHVFDTNGKLGTSNTVSWVFDYNADPKSIVNLQTNHMMVVFNGKGLDLPEIDYAPTTNAVASGP